ncbi:hypothetical protein SNE35_01960 [Paucibacter sp. R3-3]|uniref:RCK N-terminal domain-containing protein n=1 Tax=Roseateles agri TaxID=3098619 RepID=A0ABU5DD93_9BURK|nr:hypothetical protein [Paucibacter sp. R3-3]MDY0743249.1 hypothetical protein [Paucibacter sp. R3-3]
MDERVRILFCCERADSVTFVLLVLNAKVDITAIRVGKRDERLLQLARQNILALRVVASDSPVQGRFTTMHSESSVDSSLRTISASFMMPNLL